MRGFAVLALLLFGIWLMITIRMSCTGLNRSVCEALCEAKGRDLASMSPGVITQCICGGRIKIPPSLRRN